MALTFGNGVSAVITSGSGITITLPTGGVEWDDDLITIAMVTPSTTLGDLELKKTSTQSMAEEMGDFAANGYGMGVFRESYRTSMTINRVTAYQANLSGSGAHQFILKGITAKGYRVVDFNVTYYPSINGTNPVSPTVTSTSTDQMVVRGVLGVNTAGSTGSANTAPTGHTLIPGVAYSTSTGYSNAAYKAATNGAEGTATWVANNAFAHRAFAYSIVLAPATKRTGLKILSGPSNTRTTGGQPGYAVLRDRSTDRLWVVNSGTNFYSDDGNDWRIYQSNFAPHPDTNSAFTGFKAMNVGSEVFYTYADTNGTGNTYVGGFRISGDIFTDGWSETIPPPNTGVFHVYPDVVRLPNGKYRFAAHYMDGLNGWYARFYEADHLGATNANRTQLSTNWYGVGTTTMGLSPRFRRASNDPDLAFSNTPDFVSSVGSRRLVAIGGVSTYTYNSPAADTNAPTSIPGTRADIGGYVYYRPVVTTGENWYRMSEANFYTNTSQTWTVLSGQDNFPTLPSGGQNYTLIGGLNDGRIVQVVAGMGTTSTPDANKGYYWRTVDANLNVIQDWRKLPLDMSPNGLAARNHDNTPGVETGVTAILLSHRGDAFATRWWAHPQISSQQMLFLNPYEATVGGGLDGWGMVPM